MKMVKGGQRPVGTSTGTIDIVLNTFANATDDEKWALAERIQAWPASDRSHALLLLSQGKNDQARKFVLSHI